MKTADQIAAEMLAGLEGVADGPWIVSYLHDDDIEVDNPTDIHLKDADDMSIAFFEEFGPESLRMAEHVARCDPQCIRALLEDRAMWKARAEKLEAKYRKVIATMHKERLILLAPHPTPQLQVP